MVLRRMASSRSSISPVLLGPAPAFGLPLADFGEPLPLLPTRIGISHLGGEGDGGVKTPENGEEVSPDSSRLLRIASATAPSLNIALELLESGLGVLLSLWLWENVS